MEVVTLHLACAFVVAPEVLTSCIQALFFSSVRPAKRQVNGGPKARTAFRHGFIIKSLTGGRG